MVQELTTQTIRSCKLYSVEPESAFNHFPGEFYEHSDYHELIKDDISFIDPVTYVFEIIFGERFEVEKESVTSKPDLTKCFNPIILILM